MTMDGKIVADFITTGTMSAERIKGGTLKLGGENDTNGSIQVVDAEGNDLVNISKDGLILNNGVKLIGNGGVLSNLQFSAQGVSEMYGDRKQAGGYYWLGFLDTSSGIDKYDAFIDVSVPDNFTITSAYITLRHVPTEVYMSNGSKVYGYARNVKCYLADMNAEAYVSMQEMSEYSSQFGGINFDEIKDCFNNTTNSFTAEVPNADKLNITEVVSKDIGDKIQKHCRIKIATTDATPAAAKDCFAKTGFVYAFISVFGYLQ